jgi:carbonic anhydrase/acetyltransferase-like protein (isoleucine patch superfamily)
LAVVSSLVVVCAGGHGRDIAAIADASGWDVQGFLDEIDGPQVLGRPADVHLFDHHVLGHNSSAVRERMDRPEGAVSLAHPSAAVYGDLRASGGVVIGAHCTIGPEVRLGRHTHINGNVFITRAKVGDFVTVGPGATICGDVVIGAGVQIGAGAVISNLCEIGPRAVIGAGAVVPPRTVIPPNETWVGVPARKVAK